MRVGRITLGPLQKLPTRTPCCVSLRISQAGKDAQLSFSLLHFSRRLSVRGEVLFTFGGLPAGYRNFLVSLLTSRASPSPEPVIEARGVIHQARLLLGEITEGENTARYPEAFLDFVRLHLNLMLQMNEGFKDLLAILDSNAPTTFRYC